MTTASWIGSLEPIERGTGGVGVHRRDAARMAGVPGLQHVERLAAPDLADDDAVGPEPLSVERTRSLRSTPALVLERDAVGRGAAQLARVLVPDHALVEPRQLGEKRRWRASSCPELVPPAARMLRRLSTAFLQRLGLERREDAVGDVVLERDHPRRRPAGSRSAGRRHRRQQALEALARLRQLGAHHRTAGVDLGPDGRRR